MARRAILPVRSPQALHAPRVAPAKSETPLDIKVKTEPEDVPLSISQLAKNPPAPISGAPVPLPPPVIGAAVPLPPPVLGAAVPLPPLPAHVEAAPSDESPEERLRQKIMASRARKASTGGKQSQRTPPSAGAPTVDSAMSSTTAATASAPVAPASQDAPATSIATRAVDKMGNPLPFKRRAQAAATSLPPAPLSAGLPPKPPAATTAPAQRTVASPKSAATAPVAAPTVLMPAPLVQPVPAPAPLPSPSSQPTPLARPLAPGPPMRDTAPVAATPSPPPAESANTDGLGRSMIPARGHAVLVAASAPASTNGRPPPSAQPAVATQGPVPRSSAAPDAAANPSMTSSTQLPLPQASQSLKQSQQRPPSAPQIAPASRRATDARAPTNTPPASILKKPSPAFYTRPVPSGSSTTSVTSRSGLPLAPYSPPTMAKVETYHPPTPPRRAPTPESSSPSPPAVHVPRLLGRMTDAVETPALAARLSSKRPASDEPDDRLSKRMRNSVGPAPSTSLRDRLGAASPPAAPSIFERFSDVHGHDDDEFEDERYHRRRERSPSPAPAPVRRKQADTYRPQEERRVIYERARTPEIYRRSPSPVPPVAHPHARGRGRGRGRGGGASPPQRHEPYPPPAERGRGGGKNRGRGNARGRGQGGPSPRGGPASGRGKKPSIMQRIAS
ncbi:hypothetical protein AURDEDRAFT_112354 [Auricularia subglabra TFB-10046 SS5]|nr:hypothetical protein AURDEDRAFT_112354 [Auricularia subglabra TFB-10046 SS5]